MENNYTLGIDIGIASVGYGIVDEECNIIDTGVRLFDSADPSENEVRRGMRQIRRLTRRKKQRLVQLNKLWVNCGFDVNKIKNINYTLTDVLELRLKGLEYELTVDEIYKVMYSMLKNRGITHMDDEILLQDDENNNKSKKSHFQQRLENNRVELSNKYPCQIQKEKTDRIGKFRGDTSIKIDNEEILTSNIYTRKAYSDEAYAILETQSKYHSFITKEFIDKYIKIFNQKRAYYEGPGDINNRSDYGKFRLNGDEWVNIFEILIGKCTIYPEELRASRASYTSQLFNLLNDLNNITIDNRKITKKETLEIIDEFKNYKTVTINGTKVLNIIANICNVEVASIAGYRIDAKEKPVFHTLETYRMVKTKLNESYIGVCIDDIPMGLYDEISHIMTINTESDVIKKELHKLKATSINDTSCLNDQFIEFIAELALSKSSYFKNWHSFSLRLMNEIIPIMIEESKEQQTIITELGLVTKEDKFKEHKYIKSDLVVDEIYNPVVSKSIRQSIGIINALIKKYGAFETIVIELPREKNSDEQKKKYTDMQKHANELDKNINAILRDKYNIVLDNRDYSENKSLKIKLKLWYQQGGKCLYSGNDIDPEKLISVKHFDLYEVDHIIPISISFDDSQANKVLVERAENSKKGNRTPYDYFNSKTSGYTFKEYKNYVENLRAKNLINKSKKANLLFDKDITKQDVLQGFISRNLNDTRYASRVVLNSLQDYIKAHNMKTKVKVINGAFTGQFRKELEIKKNRNVFSHHGVDALICAYSSLGFNKYKNKIKSDGIIDIETGEILDEHRFNQYLEKNDVDKLYKEVMFSKSLREVSLKISKAEDNMKFSYKVDKKVNRALFDQSTYSTREIDGTDYIVNSLDIYDKDSYKTYLAKKDNLLIKKHDQKTFEKLELIEQQYKFDDDGKEVKNPFMYYKEKEGYITKYTKKGIGGAIITKLKYIDKKLGKHVEITHKYENISKDRKVVKLQMSNFRSDIYFNEATKKYAFVPIEYRHFEFEKGKRDSYILDENKYEKLKETAGIDDSYSFLFSLYTDDRIQMEYKNQLMDVRYAGVASAGQIYLKDYYKKSFGPNIEFNADKTVKDKSKNVAINQMKNIKKINTDILGNKHIIERENLNLKFGL